MVQRFESAMNLNVHIQVLALDGAYMFTHGDVRFHRAPTPSDTELQHVVDTAARTLIRAAVLVEDPQGPWLDLETDSSLAGLPQLRSAIASPLDHLPGIDFNAARRSGDVRSAKRGESVPDPVEHG